MSGVALDGEDDVEGLESGTSIAVSPDGAFTYVGTEDGTIVVFSRDSDTSALTFVDLVEDLPDIQALTISPNGDFLYAATEDGLSVLGRNDDNDALTEGVQDADSASYDGFALSPDGTSGYAVNEPSNSLTVFDIDPATGEVALASVITNGSGGADGLQDVGFIAVSPDGTSVYALAVKTGDGTIAVFDRNLETGALTFVSLFARGSDIQEGLVDASGIIVSPDGLTVYVTATFDAPEEPTLLTFSRDADTGALTLLTLSDLTEDGEPFDAEFDLVTALTVSPDGTSVYFVAYDCATLGILQRVSIGTPNFTEGTPVVIAANATISDVDSTTLDGITIMLDAAPDGAAESLSAAGLPGGITTTGYDSDTRTLTLSGTASIADYQAALRLITYTNTSAGPTATDRSVLITVTDSAGGTSSTETVTLPVSSVNDDPTLTGLGSDITVTEDAGSDVDLSAATLADADAGTNDITLTLTVGAGALFAVTGDGVTVDGFGTSTLVLTGTVSAIDTFLNTASKIQYLGAPNVNGNDATTLTITANDGGNTGTGGGTDVTLGTVNIDITAVNDTPTAIAIDGATTDTLSTFESGTDVAVGTLTATDADAGAVHTFSLVAGTGDTDNGSFSIDGTTLQANNPSALAAGSYSIRVQADDGQANGTFEQVLTIEVSSDLTVTVAAIGGDDPGDGYTAEMDDDGGLDLNEAITLANAAIDGGASAVTITLAEALRDQTIDLGSVTGPLAVRSGVTVAFDDTAGSGSVTIANNTLNLGGTLTLSVGADDTLVLGSVVDGAEGSVIKTGAGTLTLSGTNHYDGTTTVSAGKLSVAATGNLGANSDANALTLADGTTLVMTHFSPIAKNITLTGNATIQLRTPLIFARSGIKL